MTRIYTAYAPDQNITFVMEEKKLEHSTIVSVCGFYYGKPSDEGTKTYRNDLSAEIIDVKEAE